MSVATSNRAERTVQQLKRPPLHLRQASPRWLVYYYAVQIVCQLALLTGWFSGVRAALRAGTFGISLVVLAITAGRSSGRRQPAASLAIIAVTIVFLEAFNPQTSSALSALATVAQYIAILGPLLWVPRLALDISWFRRIVFILWAFQSSSAIVGTLQVYFPGVFQPALASVLTESNLSGLHITLSNGEQILRPTGLTDSPGGAAGAGMYAILLALGLWTDKPKLWLRVLLAVSIGNGMFVLYICQIRSLVVMVVIAVLITASIHALRGRIRVLAGTSSIFSAIAFATFLAATSVGGEDVTRRLSSLTDASPTQVYYSNRGIFLEHTITQLLPQYPFGAGLGRWGTLAGYFGGDASSFIYVEIQWTGWLLDGGVLLVLAYSAMLATTLWGVLKIARSSFEGDENGLVGWAATLIGYDIGTIALTFNYPVFNSGFGTDFWLLNSALIAVAAKSLRVAASSTLSK